MNKKISMNITEIELREEAIRYAAELLQKDELPSLAEVFAAGGLFVSQNYGKPIVSSSAGTVAVCNDCGKNDETVKIRPDGYGLQCYRCYKSDMDFEEDYR